MAIKMILVKADNDTSNTGKMIMTAPIVNMVIMNDSNNGEDVDNDKDDYNDESHH